MSKQKEKESSKESSVQQIIKKHFELMREKDLVVEAHWERRARALDACKVLLELISTEDMAKLLSELHLLRRKAEKECEQKK